MEDIASHEAFIFVPYKVLITVKKIQVHEIIGPILSKYPNIFSEGSEDTDEFEQLTLTLFLLYQVTLGKDSYWYPYLLTLPDVVLTAFWKTEEIEEF